MSYSNLFNWSKKIFALTFIIFVLLAFPLMIFSQTGQGESYVPLTPIGGYIPQNTSSDLTGYLNGLFRWGVAIATGLAVVMMTIGAITYMSTDAVSGKEEGKEKISAALWGLLLALGAYLLLRTINPDLLRTEPVIESTNVAGQSLNMLSVPPSSIGAAPNALAHLSATPGSSASINQMVAALNDRGITNPAAVSAILAQAQAESNFNATLSTNETGGSRGLFQVSDNVWNNYTTWAASNGYPVDSPYAQTYYMVGNFQRVDSSSWNTFQTTTSPTAALDAWRHWNFGGVNLSQRYDSANQYYQNYQQTNSWGH